LKGDTFPSSLWSLKVRNGSSFTHLLTVVQVTVYSMLTLPVGDGTQIPVYIHNINVRFIEKKFKAKVGFSDKLGIGFDILGREGFFDRFVVCFDDRRRILKIIDMNG